MKALFVDQASKTYRSQNHQTFKAVDCVSLSIDEGQIYGLLGPNGAGKSTLIGMISGSVKPDAETSNISIFGHSVLSEREKAKNLLGIVPQEVVVEPAFTVEEVLYYFCGMYGVPARERGPRIRSALESLGLLDKLKERARFLSGGMKRRLMIAKAILHKPRLLILDEPTAGVDVSLRQRIWQLVRELNQQGTTIIFTTHYLEEAEQLCEAMTVINKGKVIKEGRVRDIQQEFSKNLISFELFEPASAHLEGVRQVGTEYEYVYEDLPADMTRILAHYGRNLKSIHNESASLEKIFLELTKEGGN
ncbi:MAG TPA: ABC transporter ATP-binding protein [Candidatus Obscuribacterales bacterium]